MKKLLLFIIALSWLFSFLDISIIALTRFVNRDWMDWMHEHEVVYAQIVFPVEMILCTPAFALKPIFSEAIKEVQFTPEQYKSITHAPPPDWKGFYRPVKRGEPYQFTTWASWFLYWLGPSVMWLLAYKGVYAKRT